MARLVIATLLLFHLILLSCFVYSQGQLDYTEQGDEGALADPKEPREEQQDTNNEVPEKTEKKKKKPNKKEKKQKQQKKNDDDVDVDEEPRNKLVPDLPAVTSYGPPAGTPVATSSNAPTTQDTSAVPDLLQNVIVLTGLRLGFYNQSCPRAEEIVAESMAQIFQTNPRAPANILRLQLHDCFVGGCDASILLDSTPSGENVEKSSAINFILLKGADLIDDIKLKLEEACPQTVSCADTIAFAAREALVLTGLPRLPQPSGRRDGLVSLSANVDALKNLPEPVWTMDQEIELFKRKGFTEEEMVILNGAHSIGGAHCNVITPRLENYKNSGNPDPDLDPAFLEQLKGICFDPKEVNRNPFVNFDETPTKLDNLFYRNLVEKKALLQTDQALFTDPRTRQFVQAMADNPDEFAKRLGPLMLRMGSLEVLTEPAGEVRKTCRSTN
ncbi:hypothetical protein L6164_027286 [Bauhinia variegata]|uniref:Uncharacterized protein n=1 Tax=Bauhinia variegata TaxID=167791 RepID=A0ACB9LSQ1_BAUVA|nr:hypothetical protein L6164_027286 [Bauhinia variegata]